MGTYREIELENPLLFLPRYLDAACTARMERERRRTGKGRGMPRKKGVKLGTPAFPGEGERENVGGESTRVSWQAVDTAPDELGQ